MVWTRGPLYTELLQLAREQAEQYHFNDLDVYLRKPSGEEQYLNDNLVTMVIEVDCDLLRQVEKVLKPYGLTPEQAIVDFLNFCVNPATRDKAISLLLQWKNELE